MTYRAYQRKNATVIGKTKPRRVLRSPTNSGDAWTATYEVGSGGAADSTWVLIWVSPPAPGSGRVYGPHARRTSGGVNTYFRHRLGGALSGRVAAPSGCRL